MGLGMPQWLAVGGASAAAALLLMAPRTPAPDAGQPQVTDAQARIMEAVALANGSEPMRGILMLREIAEQEPENAEAQWHMGLLSVRSNQWDKALERFKKVRDLDAEAFPDVWAYLGRAYLMVDSTEQAISCLRRYRTLVDTDTAAAKQVDGLLEQLEGQAHEH